MKENAQAWGSRLGLILAMAGNAVGLGNFLRFPIQAVQNGGGAFIIPYIVSFLLLGLPLALIEWSTGKYAGQFGHHSPPMMLGFLDKRKIWMYVGSISLFSSVVISSYYCYIESWTLTYAIHSILGTFTGLSEEQISDFFDKYLNISSSTTGIPYENIFAFFFCLALNTIFLAKGIEKGVERVAKICMPLLLLFGLFLVYKAFTLKAGEDGATFDGLVGINFMWTPQYDSLLNPKVWLSAAGQIFFTLSLGMGCIQTYASYIKKSDDVVLNSMTSSFLNEFTEIIIGSAIIIPISIGYFGIDRVMEMCGSGGFGLAFRSLPYLFGNWGSVLSAVAGFSFFGLLFFASLTSTMALAMPTISFFRDNFRWTQFRSAIAIALAVGILGLGPIMGFKNGVFDQFDFWGGTISLFVFAMFEAILFSWVWGADKGWKLIHHSADMRLPIFFKYILKYVTPTMLIIIFITTLIKPKNDDWTLISIRGWELDNSSIIGELMHKNLGQNNSWFSNEYKSDFDGEVTTIERDANGKSIAIMTKSNEERHIAVPKHATVAVAEGDKVSVGSTLYTDKLKTCPAFYSDITRIVLLLLLFGIWAMVAKVARRVNFDQDKNQDMYNY